MKKWNWRKARRVGAFFYALFKSSRGFPFATNLSLVSVPIGLTAIVVGPEVSRAFTIIFQRPEPVYVWGVLLVLGGGNVAFGIGRRKPSLERAGLLVLAVAYAVYGVSVLVGLRVGGLVAGPTMIALAISCVQRARIITAAAAALLKAEAESEVRDALGEVTKL